MVDGVRRKKLAKALAAEGISGSAGVKTDPHAQPFGGGVDRIVKSIAEVGHLRDISRQHARHGAARNIRVSLTTTADSVELIVVDDGVGFVVSERARTGLGLRSIQERVRFMRGTVNVDSQPGEGTKVLVRIPVVAA